MPRQDYIFLEKEEAMPFALFDTVQIMVHMKSIATGEIRSYESFGIYTDEGDCVDTYIWEEGNFSCNCNRTLFWKRAGKEEVSMEDVEECGDPEYLVNLENPFNKEIFYKEFES